jgi:hypothetical protein
MPADLPAEVVRVLSFCGPVELRVGDAEDADQAFERCPVAPFDERLVAFIRRGGALEAALCRRAQVEVQARDPGGSWNLRMLGIGIPGLPVGRSPERGTFEPWLPDEARAHDRIVAELQIHHIEFRKLEAGDKVAYHGQTPSGRVARAPLATWSRLALSHPFAVLLVPAFFVPFGWLSWQGPEVVWRPLAAALAVSGAIAGLAGLRLVQLTSAWTRWRQFGGEGPPRELKDTGLAPYLALYVGIGMLGYWVGASLVVGGVWGSVLGLLTFFPNLAWFFLPILAVHHFSRAEPRDPGKGGR